MASQLKEFICNKVKDRPSVLNLAHLNAQSLNDSSHYEEFCHIFNNSGIDVIAVSETFFKPSSVTSLNGYNVFCNNRIGKGGGGVAVYVKQCIECKILSISESQYSHKPEYIILEIKLQGTAVLFACIYRPPKIGNLDIFLEDMYNFIPLYQHYIIAGDINARLGSGSDETNCIISLLNTCNVECLPYGATYHTATCDSVLDIIASNCNDMVLDYSKTPATGFSCHDLLFASYDFATPAVKPKKIMYRSYKNINLEALDLDFSQVDWNKVYHLESINEKVNRFNEIMLEIFDKHAPFKTFTPKNKDSPWMNKDILTLMDTRDGAQKLAAKSKLPEHREAFKKLRNQCKQEIRNAKLRYSYGLFNNKKTSKEIWKSLRTIGVGKTTDSHTCLIPPNDLNEHYASVSSVSDPNRIKLCIDKYENPTLNWGRHIEYLCKKVLTILSQLRRSYLHLPCDIKTTIINSIVLPHLDYGSAIMEDMLVVYQIKLQRLQNACVRFIFNLRKDEHVSPYIEKLNWLRMDQRRKISQSLLLYKILNDKTPSYLHCKFQFVSQVHQRKNRSSSQRLVVPQHRTVKYSKSFLVTACKLFNSLEIHPLLSLSFHAFKNRIRSKIIEKYGTR
ncbi:hypothetical protein ONE63_006329 [Megalurothrips usitatus]|uniref:Endonuclease/exonuclease/phosphatase domain-containing protein n=1 Tax=Megalurothrips usitatus TaxID=439358 RepID=A0AAV7XVL8_9NEOP|nr:hypothetical protein ONE63_006329 [Megalurothrips usitatus]